MMHTKIRLFSIPILLFLMVHVSSCESAMGDVDEPEEVLNDSEDNHVDVYAMRSMTSLMEVGKSLKGDLAWWGYQTGYDWLSGEEHKKEEGLAIRLYKYSGSIGIFLEMNISSFQPYPIVYNSDFRQDEEAEYLKLKVVLRNNKNGKKITFSDRDQVGSDGDASFSFDISTSDLKNYKEGMLEFTVSVETELVTFFDKRSKTKPVNAEVKFPFYVPKIYKTDLYFNGLVLNERDTKAKLGDNDWNNGTPETGILVKYGDETVLYEYSKNSFKYTPNRPLLRTFYHLSESDTVKVYALDVDYGFNGNDVINDTLVPLKLLEGTDYYDFRMKCVEKLLLYSRFQGQAN